MAVKASNQLTLIDLTDAYTIVLTNEAHTFIGGTSAVASTQTATTQIFAYLGNDQVPVTVGEITGATGISATSDGKSPAPTVTITATSALTTGGVLKLPLTVNGDIQITKEFSYAIAFAGEKGTDGVSPTVSISKSNGVTTISITDKNGTHTQKVNDGVNGTPGQPGADGKTPYFHVKYSNDGGSTFTGNSGEDVGTYIGTCTDYNSEDPTSVSSYSWARIKGEAGADALTLVVTSSAGTIFKNADIATTLTAHVYKAGAEVTGTALSALGAIKWYKDGGTTAVATGQTLTISAGSVANKASYVAQLEG